VASRLQRRFGLTEAAFFVLTPMLPDSDAQSGGILCPSSQTIAHLRPMSQI